MRVCQVFGIGLEMVNSLLECFNSKLSTLFRRIKRDEKQCSS